MKISPARIAAFEILSKIETERAFSSVLLPIYEEKLQIKDRALCHALTLGVLRKQIFLDFLIGKLTNGKKLDSAIKIIVRLGLFQLKFLDKIPAHAAINDSVNLTQRAKKTSAKGFVNAILRRYTRDNIENNLVDETEKLSVETSHPRWLLERWIKQFGFEETAKLADKNNSAAPIVFRLTNNSDENTLATLKKLNLEIHESETIENAWKTENFNEMLRLYAETGKIYFQDSGSQLIAQAVDLNSGEKFLDVCAAPGGKTTYIAKNRVDSAELIVAGDLTERRVKILQATCRKQNADSIEIVRYDAETNLPFADESFETVLVDAPCSGTGTIRHNPEIRYFLNENDFADLSKKQLQILKNASKVVTSGGKLIYSTCSLEREENEAVAEAFLHENNEYERISPNLDERFLTTESYARTFPHRDETDGFFAAVFEKKRVFGKV